VSGRCTVAWIGTGVMGRPMAGHLLAAGHALVVHSRTRAKAEGLLERGARWAGSPAEAAEGCDFAFSMVGMPDEVEAVHLGPSGTLAARRPPRVICDMSTTRPGLSLRISREAEARGIGSVDAPVSGGDVGAAAATLSIMVGARQEHFDAVRPLLEVMGRRIVRQGGPGAGQHCKLINQVVLASAMTGVCEGLVYAQRAGLDPLTVIESVGSGAAGSWALSNLGPRMLRRDFAPGFFVEHFIKDLGIALEEAERMGLDMPGLALARQLYEAVRGLDGGRGGALGTQALILALEGVGPAAAGIPLRQAPRAVPAGPRP
jgi:3-hydroxyisobutyrate dehydrogenase